jgi:hypothetical protein
MLVIMQNIMKCPVFKGLRCKAPFFNGNISCRAVRQVVYHTPAGVLVQL